MADRENSYRVRVKMVPDNGQFKVAQLDQVAQ
jgi:Mce-associated membrane protein